MSYQLLARKCRPQTFEEVVGQQPIAQTLQNAVATGRAVVVSEARAAGITEFIFVTSRGKSALEDYFDHAPELEAELRKKNKSDLMDTLKTTYMDSGAIAYIRQHKPMGLGHAVWCARRLIGNEPFAVILPDDVIAGEKSCLQQMVEAYAETGGNRVAAM